MYYTNTSHIRLIHKSYFLMIFPLKCGSFASIPEVLLIIWGEYIKDGQ